MTNQIKNMRPKLSKEEVQHLKDTETFRTPLICYQALFDYNPNWFTGSSYDPSAGDGRMTKELIDRGNAGPHYLNDIRQEELVNMERYGSTTIGDYLELNDLPVVDFLMTNPPFTRSIAFVEKAKTHVEGVICILQSIGWQSTQKRSLWLKNSNLAYVLNLPKKPRWEIDNNPEGRMNLFDYAWFIFIPGYNDLPKMDWLVQEPKADEAKD